MRNLETKKIKYFQLQNGKIEPEIILSYELFGQPIGEFPVVLVNHALTGNSNVAGENGWWNTLIGFDKAIDLNRFTVLAFNIPGNGFEDNHNLIDNYRDFTTYDIASLFWKVIDYLQVKCLFANIGGSLGGAIVWEMTFQRPDFAQNIIPIATHFESSAWVISNAMVQDLILNHSDNPIYDARIHAMLLYRTPESLNSKFGRNFQDNLADQFQVESWLVHHGEKLKQRFDLKSYKMMNYLLRTINLKQIQIEDITAKIQANIHLVAIDSDLLFDAKSTKELYNQIKEKKANVYLNEINSIHGHDAFLIEFEQLNEIIAPIFRT